MTIEVELMASFDYWIIPSTINLFSDAPGKINEHWQKYHRLCHMCVIDYDFIGKFDQDMLNDISYVRTERTQIKKTSAWSFWRAWASRQTCMNTSQCLPTKNTFFLASLTLDNPMLANDQKFWWRGPTQIWVAYLSCRTKLKHKPQNMLFCQWDDIGRFFFQLCVEENLSRSPGLLVPVR